LLSGTAATDTGKPPGLPAGLDPAIGKVGEMHGGDPLLVVDQTLAVELLTAWPGVRFLPASIGERSVKRAS